MHGLGLGFETAVCQGLGLGLETKVVARMQDQEQDQDLIQW